MENYFLKRILMLLNLTFNIVLIGFIPIGIISIFIAIYYGTVDPFAYMFIANKYNTPEKDSILHISLSILTALVYVVVYLCTYFNDNNKEETYIIDLRMLLKK